MYTAERIRLESCCTQILKALRVWDKLTPHEQEETEINLLEEMDAIEEINVAVTNRNHSEKE